MQKQGVKLNQELQLSLNDNPDNTKDTLEGLNRQ